MTMMRPASKNIQIKKIAHAIFFSLVIKLLERILGRICADPIFIKENPLTAQHHPETGINYKHFLIQR